MRHAALLPVLLLAFGAACWHLRWILLTQWKCRACGAEHASCACKPDWLRKLL